VTTVHLGFEVGSGKAIEIPLAHTFVCGQTQQSGKTTTLRAIVARSGARALAFVTKRGEDFEGRPIRPYLPREGETTIHWRQVENILASALEQRNLKFERMQIVNASKGARSLADVQANVQRLAAKIKGDTKAKEVYTLLNEYLELVLPQMRSLNASHTLDLQPGLNVMDLTGIAGQTQAMVIRAALERINHHETGVLTVLPEAWEFAPRGRSAPAKDEAIAMARKGAAPKVRNFLLVDSQDIAGVEPVVRQACSVWLLGVQRELNEVKRALAMMKQAGIATPKPKDVAQLELGQFFACWGTLALKVYVQPTWMDEAIAACVARGEWSAAEAAQTCQQLSNAGTVRRLFEQAIKPPEEQNVNVSEANALREENEHLREENSELRRRVEALEGDRAARSAPRAANNVDASQRDDVRSAAAAAPSIPARTRSFSVEESLDNEALYQAIKVRLIEEAPAVLRVLTERPEIEVRVERKIVAADGTSTKGRVAKLLANHFLDEPKRFGEILKECERTGTRLNNKTLSIALSELVVDGFLTNEGVQRYRAVPGMKVNIVDAVGA
jgi:IS5 family transposase